MLRKPEIKPSRPGQLSPQVSHYIRLTSVTGPLYVLCPPINQYMTATITDGFGRRPIQICCTRFRYIGQKDQKDDQKYQRKAGALMGMPYLPRLKARASGMFFGARIRIRRYANGENRLKLGTERHTGTSTQIESKRQDDD